MTGTQKKNRVRGQASKSQGNEHPLIQLTAKYASHFKKYGIDLQKIYALMRERVIHKKDFAKQKILLKKEVFSPIIDELVQLSDFSFPLETRIELWYIIFDLLPYTFVDKDSDAVFNLYPRFEYAGIVGIGYVLGGYDNEKVKRNIIVKAVKGERTTQKMKELFQKVLTSPYRDEFIKRTRQILEETRQIMKHTPKSEERTSKQIEEDFNFGFSWVAFYLPPD